MHKILTQVETSSKGLVPIIAASTVGTLIEWYDFFIFGSLATIISTEFFPKENPAAAFLATLATFSAGLVVRPLGAVVFGQMGDRIGRKYTFMITLLLMGGSTIAIGLVPTYESIGFMAPVIVLILRLLQGLAIGGEYGGAATYVAEHSPVRQRGFWTSWIQATSGIAFVLSITVILAIRSLMTNAAWESWGWRLPFLGSIFLVVISVYMRRKMSESPLFIQAKAEGKTSTNPLKESLGKKSNFKIVLLAFFGLTIGGGTIGWVGFYAQSFMLRTMLLDYSQANLVIISGISLGVPFFFLFGWLSDRIGRKYMLLMGMVLGIVCFRPIFSGMYQITNLQNKQEITAALKVDRNSQTLQPEVTFSTTTTQHLYSDGARSTEVMRETNTSGKLNSELVKSITLSKSGMWKLIGYVFLLQFIFTVTFAPLAAFIVELFPLKIRYTSISIPYHFGYGIFGGLSPYFASYFVEKAQLAGKTDFYLAGLTYPMVLMWVSLLIGLLYLKENERYFTLSILPRSTRNLIKRSLGFVWIGLGWVVAWFGIFEMGLPKIMSGRQEDIVFGIIMMLIITPVAAIGLYFFGKYALQGEYDHPLNTDEIPEQG